MLKPTKYQPSAKELAFLETVQNAKYDRQIITGIRKFVDTLAGLGPPNNLGQQMAVEVLERKVRRFLRENARIEQPA